jgi:DNA-binding response OmpR family regulator
VLLARIRGALRERRPPTGAVVRGRLKVDATHGEARLGDRPLKLERRPLLMLQLLAGRSGEAVPRSELLDQVWGSSYTGFEHRLEQAIHQIRRELREPGWIETVRGIGYRFVAQS